MADVGKCVLSYTEFIPVVFTQTTENIALTIQEHTVAGTQYIDEDEET
jgi:hypothetical protein